MSMIGLLRDRLLELLAEHERDGTIPTNSTVVITVHAWKLVRRVTFLLDIEHVAPPADLFELGARFGGLAKVPITDWRRRDRALNQEKANGRGHEGRI